MNTLIEIIGAHHTGGTGLNTFLKMGQINLAFSPLISSYIYLKAGYFHTVKGIVFYTGNHILFLNTPYQGTPHLPQMEGLFTIGFLTPSPARVIGQINTDATKQVATMGPYLLGDSPSDPFLQFRIKGSPPAHSYRKTGAVSLDSTSGAITKLHLRHPEPFIPTGRIGNIIIMGMGHHLLHTYPAAHQINLFLQAHLPNDSLCPISI